MRHGRRLAALACLVLAAYANSFQAGLVFDNASIVGQDPRIRAVTAQNIAAILTGRYWYVNATAGLYRPVTTLSYLLNYAVFGNGPRPAGYHWVNLLLQEANVALVYALGVMVLGESAPALALAALWGLHPLGTEAVTNIVGRADLLAACGVLAGLVCHLKGAASTGRRRMAWLAALGGAQALGIFSKENAAVLPGLMLACDLVCLERRTWRRRVQAYAAVALPLAAFFLLRGGIDLPMRIDLRENPLAGAGFWTARLTAVKVIGKGLWLFFWPASLSADYSYNAVPLFGWRMWNPEDAKALLAVAVCLGAAVLAVLLAVRRRRADRPLLFFLVFFFVALAPTANLAVLIGSIMAERFLYLPAVGLAGCVAAGACALGRRGALRHAAARRAAWAALAVVCLALGARTHARNSDWRDGLSLWASAVEACPESARPHYNLGVEFERTPGRLEDAVAEYQAALRIDPNLADAHNNLGNALFAMGGRLPEALAEYQAALRLQPERLEAHNNLANALAQMPGRLPEAVAEYRAALRLQPANPESHYNLANALVRIPERLPEAIAEYREALRLDPGHVDAHNNLGNALASIPGRLPDAIAEYRAALALRPGDAEAHVNLGNALSGMQGHLAEAIAEYQAALRIQPGNAQAHNDLGNALAQVPERLPDAAAEFQAAVGIAPDYLEGHLNLAKAWTLLPGRLPDAIAEYETALRLKPDPRIRRMLDRLRAGR